MTSKINIKDKIETGKNIKVAPFKNEIRKTEPHKHNSYFEIIYLSKSNGTHSIDHKIFQIKPPIIFFIRKEQVHHWDITSVTKGYVLIIKKEFVEKSYNSGLKNLFSKLSQLTTLQPKDHTTIEQLFKLLSKENNVTVVVALLIALLTKILDTAKPLIKKPIITNNLFQSYKELLSNTDELKNSVSHYAKQLNTTPQNLNSICRKNVNQSSTTILSEYIINEAKRLLHYTDNSVSQIAYSLGFTDSSHFVKYFKRNTGVTPQTFRNE